MGPKEYAAILDGVLDGCGIPRPLRVVDHLHNRQSGVRMQTAEYEGRHLVYLVNLLARRRTVRIVSEGSVGEMVDLISGHVCGPLLELDPLEPMLFEIGWAITRKNKEKQKNSASDNTTMCVSRSRYTFESGGLTSICASCLIW